MKPTKFFTAVTLATVLAMTLATGPAAAFVGGVTPVLTFPDAGGATTGTDTPTRGATVIDD